MNRGYKSYRSQKKSYPCLTLKYPTKQGGNQNQQVGKMFEGDVIHWHNLTKQTMQWRRLNKFHKVTLFLIRPTDTVNPDLSLIKLEKNQKKLLEQLLRIRVLNNSRTAHLSTFKNALLASSKFKDKAEDNLRVSAWAMENCRASKKFKSLSNFICGKQKNIFTLQIPFIDANFQSEKWTLIFRWVKNIPSAYFKTSLHEWIDTRIYN